LLRKMGKRKTKKPRKSKILRKIFAFAYAHAYYYYTAQEHIKKGHRTQRDGSKAHYLFLPLFQG